MALITSKTYISSPETCWMTPVFPNPCRTSVMMTIMQILLSQTRRAKRKVMAMVKAIEWSNTKTLVRCFMTHFLKAKKIWILTKTTKQLPLAQLASENKTTLSRLRWHRWGWTQSIWVAKFQLIGATKPLQLGGLVALSLIWTFLVQVVFVWVLQLPRPWSTGLKRLAFPTNDVSFARALATTSAIIAKLPVQPWTIWAGACSPHSKSKFEQRPLL